MKLLRRSAFRLAAPLALAALLLSATALAAQNTSAVYVAKDGKRIAASFDNKAQTVTLRLPDGGGLTLPIAMSGSGARYSDGTLTFWEHQGSAVLLREKDDALLFEGEAAPDAVAPVDDAALRQAAAQYAAALRRADKGFREAMPPEPFGCELDAGRDRPPLKARCVNEVDAVAVHGALVSVGYAPLPVEVGLRKHPVMADGRLALLLRRDNSGAWHGVGWFAGSDSPSLDARRMKALGLGPADLEAVGWTEEPEQPR